MVGFPSQGLVSLSLILDLGVRLLSKLCQGMGILIMDNHLSFQNYGNPC